MKYLETVLLVVALVTSLWAAKLGLLPEVQIPHGLMSVLKDKGRVTQRMPSLAQDTAEQNRQRHRRVMGWLVIAAFAALAGGLLQIWNPTG